jgi:transcriptional regulator with XRE-family HTH domain
MQRANRPLDLRGARKGLRLTLERTAVAAGISVAWLRQLERDPTLLSDRIADKLLPVLGFAAEERRP